MLLLLGQFTPGGEIEPISVSRALCVFLTISVHSHTRQAVVIVLRINGGHSKDNYSYRSSSGCFCDHRLPRRR
jgi:hypothetical protein